MPARARGQIIEKGPNTFLVRVFIGRDAHGKRQYASQVVHGTRKQAEQVRTERLAAVDTHTAVPAHALTVGEFFTDWLAHRPDLAPSTVAGYLFIWRRYLSPFLGHLKLQAVGPEHLQRAITAIQSRHGVAPSTLRQHANVLKAGFAAAVLRRKIAHDPTAGLLLPKVETREKLCWSPTDLRRFFTLTQDSWLGPLWYTLGTTGLRPGEACVLTWADWVKDTLRVTKNLSKRKDGTDGAMPTKTNRMRSVLLPGSTVSVLQGHRKRVLEARLKARVWEREDLIFPNTRGRVYTPNVLNHLFTKEVERLGLPKVSLYSLRHAHATDLLSQGTNPKIVSERLGHSSVVITLNTYSHVLPDIQAESMTNFDKSLSEPPPHHAEVM